MTDEGGFRMENCYREKIQEGVVCHCERSEAIQSKLSGLPRRAKICPPRNDGIFVKFCNKIVKNSKDFQKLAVLHVGQHNSNYVN